MEYRRGHSAPAGAQTSVSTTLRPHGRRLPPRFAPADATARSTVRSCVAKSWSPSRGGASPTSGPSPDNAKPPRGQAFIEKGYRKKRLACDHGVVKEKRPVVCKKWLTKALLNRGRSGQGLVEQAVVARQSHSLPCGSSSPTRAWEPGAPRKRTFLCGLGEYYRP